jgi:anti-sigma B factor antagonist
LYAWVALLPEELSFSISTTSLAECEVVTVRGELDGATAPKLATELDRLAADGKSVVLDLSELSFIDSGGLHAVMKPAPRDRRVCLVCPDGNVSKVLSIVQIEQVMPVFERLDDALASLR